MPSWAVAPEVLQSDFLTMSNERSFLGTWWSNPKWSLLGTTCSNQRQMRWKRRERKRGESSRLPMSELLTGTLEHRHQPQYQPYRVKAKTREGRYRERSTWTRRTRKDPATERRVAGSCPSDSKVLKGDRQKEKGSQCCPTLQRADSREVISWNGRPIELQNEREGNRWLFDPMVGHTLVSQLLGKNEKMVKC